MTYQEMYSHREPEGHEEFMAKRLDEMTRRNEEVWDKLTQFIESGDPTSKYTMRANDLRWLITHLKSGFLDGAFRGSTPEVDLLLKRLIDKP